LEVNTSSVSSNLGGGRHHYLGVVIDAQTYAIIVGNNATGSPQTFIIPTFLGIFQMWWEEIKLLEKKIYASSVY
jgi:hypothetical protein